MTSRRRALARSSIMLAAALTVPLLGLASASSASAVAVHAVHQAQQFIPASGPIICCKGGSGVQVAASGR